MLIIVHFLNHIQKFYNNIYLPKSHSYLDANISNDDNLKTIKFERILPINQESIPTKKLVCELIGNNGSIFGHIYFTHAFLLFISDINSDPRKKKKQ